MAFQSCYGGDMKVRLIAENTDKTKSDRVTQTKLKQST
uniref:Uncharacterized protein n=1 Tax=Anguilla anguilla TaxID=7936 RepID=A0A0E9W029_ANGAN